MIWINLFYILLNVEIPAFWPDGVFPAYLLMVPSGNTQSVAASCPNIPEGSKLSQFPVCGRVMWGRARTIRQSPSEDLGVRTDNLRITHPAWGGVWRRIHRPFVKQPAEQLVCLAFIWSVPSTTYLLIKLLSCDLNKKTQPVWIQFNIQWFMETGYF